MAFDPSKHRKTQEKLATLQNTKQLVWKIDKPKKKDYVRSRLNDHFLALLQFSKVCLTHAPAAGRQLNGFSKEFSDGFRGFQGCRRHPRVFNDFQRFPIVFQ